MLTVQTPLVTPDFALRDTIVVLAGVVLGGLNRPIPATLGGFSIGFASGLLGGALPTEQSQYLPTFLFAAVILVLLVRPNGLFTRRQRGGARVKRAAPLVQLAAPARARRRRSARRHPRVASSEGYFIDALVKVAIVVALYLFIGNSGVLSFGHISFVALGAWLAGVLSVPVAEKPAIMPSLARFPARPHRRQRPLARCSLRSSGASSRWLSVSRSCASRASPRASPPSQCSRSRTTFSATTRRSAPASTRSRRCPRRRACWQATIGALLVIGVAFAYQRSRFGRLLRATREDPAAASAVGVSVYRQRLGAFVLPARSQASPAACTSTCCP